MSSQEIIIEEGILKGTILHSLWLRERLSGDKFVDPNNLQRLYEPSLLDENLLIDSYAIKDNFLSITFSGFLYSIYLWLIGSQTDSIYMGVWVAILMGFGIYIKLLRIVHFVLYRNLEESHRDD